MEINISKELQMPINAATKSFAILAKRGAGKSYTGAVMAEEFHKNNIPFVVFDPIDVWWGLKFKQTGKNEDGSPILGKGLPIVVFGLEHADIKIEKDGLSNSLYKALRDLQYKIEWLKLNLHLDVYLAKKGTKRGEITYDRI